MTVGSTELEWLQRWYADHCDGFWEHTRGVRIETLDNPGWSLSIDLTGTELESRPFTARFHDVSASDWISVKVENGTFKGAGDSAKLGALIAAFRAFAAA